MLSYLNESNKLCYIHIQSGSGGIDSKNWIVMLAKMYIKWANINNLKVKIISEYIIDSNKNNCIMLKINGKNSYELFKNEEGIHRLIRKSPFDSWKRHTSFGSVCIYKKIKEENNINLNIKDLKIDCYKSSGAGGQHVNKTESAIRIKHIPTGIISKCQNNRSQYKNKNEALNKLKLKLNNLQLEKLKNKKKINNIYKLDISWSNHIRSYILDNSLIKDIKTGIKTNNIKDVLNGNLRIFIKNNFK